MSRDHDHHHFPSEAAAGKPAEVATVPVAELFYSFQGEGPNLGRRALFARFMGCNLTCGYAGRPSDTQQRPVGSMACDTEYTWRPTPAQGHTGTSDQHDHDPPGPVVKAPPRVQHLTRARCGGPWCSWTRPPPRRASHRSIWSW